MLLWCLAFLTLNAIVLIVSAGIPSHTVQECGVRFEDNDVCACSTHHPHGPVKCRDDNHSIEIQRCYCMYYDKNLHMTIVGHCLLSCYQLPYTIVDITSSTEFNNDICNIHRLVGLGLMHRMGRFCGECNDTYGLAVYSYQYISCVPCQQYGYKNWLKYFAISLIPLTLFYILAVLLSFNVTSSSMNGQILVMQCILSPDILLIVQGGIEQGQNMSRKHFYKTVLNIFSATNLDFFRWVYPPFCLHPKATIFGVLSLDYIVALYPFLLIFVTYGLVTAYDKRYRLLVWTWKPFKMCINRYRRTWDIRTSLIEIFATFILLSSVKILGVSFQILSFTPTYTVAGKRLDHYFTLYDANLEYFGSQHLPFALLAIAISSIFVLLPLLLLAIYPCGCFQRCLNRCGLTCRTLHVFMDAFQGSYRTQPRDTRYFSAFYLLLRVLILAQVQIFKSRFIFYTSGILSLVFSALIALFQPYKVPSHNSKDSILMTCMGIYFISIHATELLIQYGYSYEQKFGQSIELATAIILTCHLPLFLMWKLLRSPIGVVIKKIKATWNSTMSNHEDNGIKWFDRGYDTSEIHIYPPLLGQQKDNCA